MKKHTISTGPNNPESKRPRTAPLRLQVGGQGKTYSSAPVLYTPSPDEESELDDHNDPLASGFTTEDEDDIYPTLLQTSSAASATGTNKRSMNLVDISSIIGAIISKNTTQLKCFTDGLDLNNLNGNRIKYERKIYTDFITIALVKNCAGVIPTLILAGATATLAHLELVINKGMDVDAIDAITSSLKIQNIVISTAIFDLLATKKRPKGYGHGYISALRAQFEAHNTSLSSNPEEPTAAPQTPHTSQMSSMDALVAASIMSSSTTITPQFNFSQHKPATILTSASTTTTTSTTMPAYSPTHLAVATQPAPHGSIAALQARLSKLQQANTQVQTLFEQFKQSVTQLNTASSKNAELMLNYLVALFTVDEAKRAILHYNTEYCIACEKPASLEFFKDNLPALFAKFELATKERKKIEAATLNAVTECIALMPTNEVFACDLSRYKTHISKTPSYKKVVIKPEAELQTEEALLAEIEALNVQHIALIANATEAYIAACNKLNGIGANLQKELQGYKTAKETFEHQQVEFFKQLFATTHAPVTTKPEDLLQTKFPKLYSEFESIANLRRTKRSELHKHLANGRMALTSRATSTVSPSMASKTQTAQPQKLAL